LTSFQPPSASCCTAAADMTTADSVTAERGNFRELDGAFVLLLHGIIIKGKQNNSTLSTLTSTLNTYRQSEGRSFGHTVGFRTAANSNTEFM